MRIHAALDFPPLRFVVSVNAVMRESEGGRVGGRKEERERESVGCMPGGSLTGRKDRGRKQPHASFSCSVPLPKLNCLPVAKDHRLWSLRSQLPVLPMGGREGKGREGGDMERMREGRQGEVGGKENERERERERERGGE